MRKTILSIAALCIAAVLLLPSCSALQINDTNGDDDYTLEQLTEEDLFKRNTSTELLSSSRTINNKTTVKIKKISGLREFRSFKNGSYTINVDFKVNAGNVRLVLHDGENVLKEFEPNKDGQSFSFDCGDGTVFLKGAFESAEIELVYTVEKAVQK